MISCFLVPKRIEHGLSLLRRSLRTARRALDFDDDLVYREEVAKLKALRAAQRLKAAIFITL